MSELPTAAVPPLRAGRVAVCLALLAALVLVGFYQVEVFALLTRAWNSVLTAVGLGGLLARLQQGTDPTITKSSIPAIITGSLVYIGVCVLVFHLLLRSGTRTWWVVQVYLVLFGVCLLLLLLGKVTGGVLFYKVARRIIDLTVSPVPLILLLPLLWPGWGVGIRN